MDRILSVKDLFDDNDQLLSKYGAMLEDKLDNIKRNIIEQV